MLNRQNEWKTLAEKIVGDSLQLQTNDRVFIDLMGEADELVEAIIKELYRIGAQPYLRVMPIHHLKSIIMGCSKEQIMLWTKQELYKLKNMNAYISIRTDENIFEWNDIPPEKFDLYLKHYAYPMTSGMVGTGKYIILKYPTPGMAQLSRMSLDSFTNLYFRACNMDYRQLEEGAQALADILSQTDRVRIVAPGTDLSFSIKGIPNYFCNGQFNLPDGEIFTAPILDSVEGTIAFNVPAVFLGMAFDHVRFEFKAGKIVNAVSNDNRKLMGILKADEGASRLGEFGIGLNPHLRIPVSNLLFDEKMAGSVHLAIGHALPMADNGNVSSVHWDLVLSQLEEHGGGELYFDDVLVRKNGYFVSEELSHLNPY
ncbi:aminopeptidase [Brevibacillus migulae]|uniref:aminopeptidase n=1 Tax=Brevibacillus migulae TaxID=1644114 RepID=UPI00106EEBBF|nr:aminopeptidase [Brevibacillus migulae]